MVQDLQTINEWRQLGYYYEYENNFDQWRIYGSQKGLRCFINHLTSFINNPENAQISEHVHLGPYNYLKIMTWHNSKISDNYIAGTLLDFKNAYTTY